MQPVAKNKEVPLFACCCLTLSSNLLGGQRVNLCNVHGDKARPRETVICMGGLISEDNGSRFGINYKHYRPVVVKKPEEIQIRRSFCYAGACSQQPQTYKQRDEALLNWGTSFGGCRSNGQSPHGAR